MKERGLLGRSLQQKRQELGLTQDQLARKADIPYNTLIKIESGAIRNPSVAVVSKIARALSLSVDSLLVPRTEFGAEALPRLWQDVLASMKVTGDFMCISGLDEKRFLKANKKGLAQFIEELKRRGLRQLLLNCEGDTTYLKGEHLEYRWIPKEFFSSTPIYVYANRVAMLIWGEPLQIVILENELLADAYRKQFLFLWEHAKQAPRAKKTKKRS